MPARLTGAMVLMLCGLFAVLSAVPARTATAQASDESKSNADQPLLRETGEFELQVVGPDGKPVPAATVEIRVNPKPTAEQILKGQFVRQKNYGSLATTDAEGRLRIKLPLTQQRLDVNITTPGYGPYWAAWSSENQGAPIPATFTAELEAGWSVGGIVVDDEDRPVAGVEIHPSIKYRKRPGDLHDLHVGASVKTDAEGKWRFDSVPASKEDVFVEISHADYMPLRRPLPRSEFGIAPGHQPANLILLDRGLTVTGTITDDAGNPIAGARVRTKFANDLREAKTDDEGVYQLAGCESRTARIVVSAKGRATDMQEVKIDQEMKPVDFQMQPGGTVRIHVLDQAGNPVPKARIFFQRWRGNQHSYFEFDHVGQYADENGVWVWNEAPLDEFKADICPPEGMELGSQPLIARAEPYVFRTPPALVITGRVLDAETKQPIPKFRVVPGVRYESGRLSWMNREQFDAADGKYRIRHTNHRDAFLVRIEAAGYRADVSRDIRSDEGAVAIDFELMKGIDVAAAILTPEGAPAAGAQVALGIAGSQISIKNGELFDISTFCARQNADDDGRFQFPPQQTPYQLVILHPAGYAHVKATPEERLSTITLEPWAQVEGTFFVGKNPVPRAPIEIYATSLSSYGEDVPSISTQHNVTADAEGRFRFPRVIPGKAGIGRRILLTVENGAEDITSSCRIRANFAAGELTQLNLGGTGRPVVGKLRPPEGFDGRVNWNFALIHAGTSLTVPPMPNGPQLPDDVKQDPAKQAAWLLKWRLTDEGQAWTVWEKAAAEIEQRRDASPRFTASVDRDGTFVIDDVPAGTYTLSAGFDRKGPGHLQDYRFTVPAMEEGRSDDPLDLGVLRLDP